MLFQTSMLANQAAISSEEYTASQNVTALTFTNVKNSLGFTETTGKWLYVLKSYGGSTSISTDQLLIYFVINETNVESICKQNSDNQAHGLYYDRNTAGSVDSGRGKIAQNSVYIRLNITPSDIIEK